VESSPGPCRVCGIALVPASQFGFADKPSSGGTALVVPRNAVLMAGSDSVLYVETEPGRFEIRNLVLGPRIGDQIVVVKGVEEGEQVAVSGNFLIDSQMQLSGNPSLIDPLKAQPSVDFELDEESMPPIGDIELFAGGIIDSTPSSFKLVGQNDEPDEEILAAIGELSPEDQQLALQQKMCPVADMPLGSMGAPIKVMVEGRPVFICCEGCRDSLLAEPAKHFAKIEKEAIR